MITSRVMKEEEEDGGMGYKVEYRDVEEERRGTHRGNAQLLHGNKREKNHQSHNELSCENESGNCQNDDTV